MATFLSTFPMTIIDILHFLTECVQWNTHQNSDNQFVWLAFQVMTISIWILFSRVQIFLWSQPCIYFTSRNNIWFRWGWHHGRQWDSVGSTGKYLESYGSGWQYLHVHSAHTCICLFVQINGCSWYMYFPATAKFISCLKSFSNIVKVSPVCCRYIIQCKFL